MKREEGRTNEKEREQVGKVVREWHDPKGSLAGSDRRPMRYRCHLQAHSLGTCTSACGLSPPSSHVTTFSGVQRQGPAQDIKAVVHCSEDALERRLLSVGEPC